MDTESAAILQRFDLNLLIHLEALLEHRHVTRAADAVGIGQSAMSTALARLRRVFDDPLLVRTGHIHKLTPVGQSLVEPLNAILVSMGRLLSSEQDFDPASAQRVFTVIASDYVTLVLLKPLLKELYSAAPGIAVNVIAVSGTTEIELSRSNVDLVIMPRGLASPGMRTYPSRALFTDRYVATVWTHHREVGDRVDSTQLEKVRYVRYFAPAGGNASIDNQLDALGVHPDVALTTHSFTLVPLLLPGTPLFAFIHERLLRLTPYRDEVRAVECDLPLQPIVEVMYWHPVFHNDPAHHWLRKKVAAVAAEIQ